MSNAYWSQRFVKEEAIINKLGKKELKKAYKEYDKTLMHINKKIYSWYAKYAKDNKLNFSEAKKQLDLRERKEFKMTLDEYVKKGESLNIKTDAKVLKELKNASARVHIDRLESLKQEIKAEIHLMTKNLENITEKHLTNVYEGSYYNSMYTIQKGLNNFNSIQKLDVNTVRQFIHKPWTQDSKNWSTRIWGHDSRISNMIHQGLMQNIVAGKSIDEITDNISKRFNVEKHIASRLILTESAAYHEKAKQQTYKDLDVEKFEIVATLDTRTSSICRQMDSKVYPISEYEVGITAPPFHVNCRSTTAPYFDDDKDAERVARDKDGKNYKVNGMPYNEWYDKYVKTNPGESIAEKIWQNRFSDKNQFEKYKGILGKELPETFEKFQELKYNDSKKWRKMKLYSKVVQFGEISPLVGFEYFEKYRLNLERLLIGLKTPSGSEIKGVGTHFVSRAIGTHKWLGQKKMKIDLGRPFNHRHVQTTDIIECVKKGKIVKRAKNSIVYRLSGKCQISINTKTKILIQCNPVNKL